VYDRLLQVPESSEHSLDLRKRPDVWDICHSHARLLNESGQDIVQRTPHKNFTGANLTRTVVNHLLEIVHPGIVVIAAVLRKMPASDPKGVCPGTV
jgi:hypothetical protein